MKQVKSRKTESQGTPRRAGWFPLRVRLGERRETAARDGRTAPSAVKSVEHPAGHSPTKAAHLRGGGRGEGLDPSRIE